MDKNAFEQISEDERKRLSPAIWNFTSAFSSSQEYKDYEKALSRMNQDAAAQKDLKLFQEKQQEINRTYRQDGNREKALAELKSIQEKLMQNTTISAYSIAQEELSALCAEAGTILSKNIGLDYAAVCAPSCCG
jgi:cell fate (sporulation/competence/biofilm development) regulator YlbF (YheA/YmcA/DUF963 family)